MSVQETEAWKEYISQQTYQETRVAILPQTPSPWKVDGSYQKVWGLKDLLKKKIGFKS